MVEVEPSWKEISARQPTKKIVRELRALFTTGGWVGLKHPTLVVVEALQELIDITGQLMFLEGGRDDNLPQLQGSR